MLQRIADLEKHYASIRTENIMLEHEIACLRQSRAVLEAIVAKYDEALASDMYKVVHRAANSNKYAISETFEYDEKQSDVLFVSDVRRWAVHLRHSLEDLGSGERKPVFKVTTAMLENIMKDRIAEPMDRIVLKFEKLFKRIREASRELTEECAALKEDREVNHKRLVKALQYFYKEKKKVEEENAV